MVRGAETARIQIVEKSATSGRNPARRALPPKPAEDAAIKIAAPASGDLTRETEGIAKIEADRLGEDAIR